MTRHLLTIPLLALLPLLARAQDVVRGAPAPDIDLPTLDGGRVKLSALKGRPVIVMFWGTWCPPCRQEFIDLVDSRKATQKAGLVILAVNQTDQEMQRSDISSFVKTLSAHFTIALDARGVTRRNFRLLALPTTVFIDSAGVVRDVRSGPISRGELAEGLSMILRPK